MKNKDLNKIAPKLSVISLSKTGFEIPKNYFDTVEDAIIAKLKADNLQNKINSKTFKTPKNYFDSIENIVIAKLKAEVILDKNENLDTIPIDYFETLENKVISKIKATPRVISLRRKFIKYVAPIAIAASLLLVFVLNNTPATVTFDSIASSEIESWIDNGNIDIDALSIASLYPEIELNDEMYSNSLTNEEILDYLYEENFEDIIYEN